MEALVLIHLRSGDQQTYRSFLGPSIILVLVWSLPAEVPLLRSIGVPLKYCVQVAAYI